MAIPESRDDSIDGVEEEHDADDVVAAVDTFCSVPFGSNSADVVGVSEGLESSLAFSELVGENLPEMRRAIS